MLLIHSFRVFRALGFRPKDFYVFRASGHDDLGLEGERAFWLYGTEFPSIQSSGFTNPLKPQARKPPAWRTLSEVGTPFKKRGPASVSNMRSKRPLIGPDLAM